MLKSNPIPARWATHKWENNSTKCSCIDMKVLGITSVFPTWGSSKGTGNPQGIWPWRPAGFDYKIPTGLGDQRLQGLWWNKTLYTPRLRGKEKWLDRKLNQNHLVVLEGLLWRCRSAGAPQRDGGGGRCMGLAAAVWGGHLWGKPSWRPPPTWPYCP